MDTNTLKLQTQALWSRDFATESNVIDRCDSNDLCSDLFKVVEEFKAGRKGLLIKKNGAIVYKVSQDERAYPVVYCPFCGEKTCE